MSHDPFVGLRMDQKLLDRLDAIAQPFNRSRILREALEQYLDQVEHKQDPADSHLIEVSR